MKCFQTFNNLIILIDIVAKPIINLLKVVKNMMSIRNMGYENNG
jgi:hypothetical protein